ncbi:hypothetical protein [Pseudomonas arsenicoxydans]|uniref:Uncharacterized protein n=1 Tax=Pseudomonas arsenicoxydans TaxID=702115 RepID=A0A4P6G274_9PSED|nr:hypothetical protein [Pseudomonas arsenicoxydans]QAY83360.1 hypothetical protein CUN61_04975 [Pseudomonas arsenicoxydans]
MRTDLRDHEFPELYRRFLTLFPDKPWLKRVANLQHQVNENPISKFWLWQVNVVAYGLAAFDTHGLEQVEIESWDAVKQAMIFICQILDIHDTAPPDNARMFRGRIRGAISNPDDMRGIRFELGMATHLFRQGCSITWTDEHRGDETFDFLADVPGVGSVEVECKTLSADKGEPIARDIAYAFINRLFPKIEPALPFQGRFLYTISLVFQSNIPKNTTAQATIAAEVAEAIKREEQSVDGVCSIHLQALDLKPLEEGLERDHLLDYSNQMLGYEPAHQVIKDLGEAGYLAVRVQSVVASKLETAVNDLAKRAIRKQLTGNRPACLVMRIERHSGESLEALAEDESNWLATRATKLLKNPAHDHLAAVVFVSAPAVTAVTESSEVEQSKTYIFESQQGNYSLLGLNHLFGVVAKG